jgi:predicted dehydrogenase
MPGTLRVALIGYGYWGPNYARVLEEMADTELTLICDANGERLERAAKRVPRAILTQDLGEALERTDIDAVVVSTPASTHFEVTRRALESGRDVLVEKPLALEVSHCEELTELSEKKGRILMVAHTFLYNPGIQKLRECVRSSSFGRTYYLHATRTNLGPIRHDVNSVWDLAPHDISIFNYVLDEVPTWVSANASRVLENPREDVAFITLGYSNNVMANIHVSWADPNKVRRVVAVGSYQRVVFDDLNPLERIRIFEKGVSVGEMDADTYGEFKLLMRDGDILSPRIENSEPLKNQCADFVSAVRQRSKPLSDARTGTDVVMTLQAVDASVRERGKAVEVAKWRVASRSL